MCGMLTIVPAFLSCLLDPHFQTSKLLPSGYLHFHWDAEQQRQLFQRDLDVRDLLCDLVMVVDFPIADEHFGRKYLSLRLAQLLCQLCHLFDGYSDLHIAAEYLDCVSIDFRCFSHSAPPPFPCAPA